MATLLSFLLTVAYWPGIPGSALTPRWALLAVGVPLLLMRKEVVPLETRRSFEARPTLGFWLSVAFLGWATLSMLWTPSPWDGLLALEQLALLFGVGYLGYTLADLRPVYFGFALGMLVNGILIMIELGGYDVTGQLIYQQRAALFFNPNVVTETGVLVLVAAAAHRMWFAGLCCTPAIFLTHSRGGTVALACSTLFWAGNKSRRLLLVGCAIAFGLSLAALIFNHTGTFRGGMLINPASTQDRLNIWRDTVGLLTPFGHGVGSLHVMFPRTLGGYTDHAHNDYLELAHDFGVPGILLIGALLVLALRKDEPERYVLIAFMTEALFQFPMWMPVTGTIGALAIGRLLR